MTTDTEEMIEQCDRDRAGDWWDGIGSSTDDIERLAQAFALHRLAERAAIVAWLWDVSDEYEQPFFDLFAHAIEQGQHQERKK